MTLLKPEISYQIIKAPPALTSMYIELDRHRTFKFFNYILNQCFVAKTFEFITGLYRA